MILEWKNVTERHLGANGRTKGFASVSALMALALLGCGSETGAASTEGTASGATPAASAGAAGSAASSTAAGAAPGTTTTSATDTGSTATAPNADPASDMSGTTPASGMMAAGPSGQSGAMTPGQTGMMPPANSGSMMPAGAAGSGATPPAMTGVELPVETGTPTLFWLEITSNAVYTASPDGSGQRRFASGSPLSAPDGVAVDPKGGWVYVLNMGTVLGGGNLGSMVRYKLDGSSPETIMPAGSMADGETFNTGKQLSIDKVNSKLYLGDREGSKVWRTDLDGKNLEVLVSGHGLQQVVGVAPDPIANEFYFSDRNGKKLFRASMEMPAGQTHADRDDVELIYADKAPNAMPLDIELDVEERIMYWTDRQQNKVFSMPMDMPMGADGNTRTDVKTVADGLTDVIGLGFDHENKVLYATHSGSVSSFKADGSDRPQRIGSSGRTGLAFTKIP